MTRKMCSSLVAVALTVACTRATPEQQIVNDAAAALGGAERVSAVKTLVLEGTGTQYNLGQDSCPVRRVRHSRSARSSAPWTWPGAAPARS